MNKLLFILLFPAFCIAQTKPIYVRTPDGPNIISDANLKVAKYFIVPVLDGSGIVGGSAVDSAGYIRYNPTTKAFQGYYGATKGWQPIGGSVIFRNDFANTVTMPVVITGYQASFAATYGADPTFICQELVSTGVWRDRVDVSPVRNFVGGVLSSVSFDFNAQCTGRIIVKP